MRMRGEILLFMRKTHAHAKFCASKISAPVAQLEERLRPKEKVGGSIPPGGGRFPLQ